MRSAISVDGNNFTETEFGLEKEFEKIIKDNSRILFGQKTVYMFDLKDKDNLEFYGNTT